MFKRVFLYVVVMLILLALAISAGQWDKGTVLLQQQASEISVWLTQQISDAPNGRGAGTLLVHRGDSLVSWSNARLIPSKRDLKELSEKSGYSLLRLPHGYFLAFVEKTGTDTRSTLIPIKYDLNFNGLAEKFVFPENSKISNNIRFNAELKTDYPVTIEGKEICWLSKDESVQSVWLSWLKLGAWLLFFGVFFSLLAQIGRAVSHRFGWLVGSGLVAIVSTVLTWLNLQTGFTTEQFGALPLFAQTFDNATLIGNSVGDWLIQVGILVFVMGFFHSAPLTERLENSSKLGIPMTVLSNVLAMLSILIGTEAMRQLVFRSRIGFDFDHVLNLGTLGFLALAGVVALMVGLFLFSHRLAIAVRHFQLSRNQRLLSIGLATVVFAALCFLIEQPETNLLWLIVFGLIYALALDAFAHWQGGGFGWAICWLVLFSLFASTQLTRFNGLRDKELRLDYAKTLATNRDTTLAEKLLPNIVQALKTDAANIGRLLKPWPFKAGANELRDYLNRMVFKQNYLFQHYRLSVFAFDKETQPLLMGQTLGYEQVVLGNWATAKPVDGSNEIRFGHDSEGNPRYLLHLTVDRMEDPSQPAAVYLFFDLNHPAPTRTFSQLFFNSPLRNLTQLPRYDFSISKNGLLSVDQGLANMTVLGANLASSTVADFETSTRVDAVAKSADGQTLAAVGHKTGGWLKQVYLFSIIFTLAALCLIALALANAWLGFLPAEYGFRLTASGSLARRIHFWNVSLLAVSFLVVGYLTYQHFTRAARDAERSDFNYRATALLTNLKNQALNAAISDDSLRQGLPQSLSTMTASLGMDAQFFDPAGNLVFATQQELVKLGVLPSKMNPAALAFLKTNPHSERIEAEQSAGLPYFTQYRSLQNVQGKILGFLAVPYQESKGNAGAEVSDFIGMLASLYVFLLLIAFGVTYLLARSITRPVSLLSEKVQELRLEDKNEPLAYEGDSEDEISQLIGQYNRMVAKLESSKVQLVKLEREGAWREMARQVAHDIKNPLTTMKLSMQQLERLSGNPEQAAAYLRKAITRLIEQIDSLAQIASEFSMFANLDIKSKNDVVINEVVESVHDLFSEQKQVGLSLYLPEERFHILGDKNHLIRVFNNLVINAIQAIPSDRQGQIKVSLTRQGNLSVIQISDNGGGIPPEIRDRVFEPNFTTKTSGSGLGLAICKKIIEAHDGDIRFETRDNEGTDFFVEIPMVAVG
ncbi:MAG: HAMP domain-containing sensor histidine kinase [Saprospiraceae bacterium]|nr:HAMP domain-containing sensor histidine kinase [Saprospiraceae bacterium]